MKIDLVRPFLDLTLPHTAILASIAATWGFLTIAGFDSPVLMILVTTYFALVTAALNSFNQIADVASDKLGWSERPLPREVITRDKAIRFTLTLMTISWILLILSSTFAFSVGFLIIALSDSALAVLYSFRPIRFKRIPVLKNFILPVHILVVPYMAILALGGVAFFPPIIILMLLFDGTATLMIADYVNIEGDNLVGDKTAPIVFGSFGAKIIIMGLYLGSTFIAVASYVFEPAQFFWVIVILVQIGMITISYGVNTRRNHKVIYQRNVALSMLVSFVILAALWMSLL
ncbi:MAG: UbiA prenyltransferase family protein [Nitrososphaerales archaeon]|nr:UbiA prenyltransferase family protein [Nitrososphaerota archaeon]